MREILCETRHLVASETRFAHAFAGVEIERLHTPIGSAIGAETLAEPAVGITAELIRVRAEQPG